MQIHIANFNEALITRYNNQKNVLTQEQTTEVTFFMLSFAYVRTTYVLYVYFRMHAFDLLLLRLLFFKRILLHLNFLRFRTKIFKIDTVQSDRIMTIEKQAAMGNLASRYGLVEFCQLLRTSPWLCLITNIGQKPASKSY